MDNEKCLEYYMDSKKYSKEDIEKNIEETKKEYPKKKIKVNVSLNDFGVYVITFRFENKNTIFNRIVLFLKRKFNKTLLLQDKNIIKKNKKIKQSKEKSRLEKYYGHKYGQYRETKTYKPY